MRIEKLNQTTKKNLLEDLLKRSPNSYEMYEEQVKAILDNVKKRGDEALFEYTEKFDGFCLDQQSVLVKEEEIEEAYTQVDRGLIEIIRKALKNIETYHEKQRQYSWFDSKPDGTILGQKVTALDRVGVYVPGGKAAYPSSVLMNIVPAKTAGVREIIMVTPPGKDGKVTPTTLVAAKEAGADKIYKVGGAQAIAALAYGTESISKVDKIVGPGNIYVALAKKAVYGHVSIDSIAGPSEILVLADETANPRYVAADLLSQAEHDEMASEPLGDYFAGPNHVLPTNGTAKFFYPLSVDDFIKKSSIISYSREALEKIHSDIERFAEAEHLTAHANSIKVRFESERGE